MKWASGALTSSRSFTGLLVAAVIFFVAVIAVFVLTVREQQNLTERVKENALWACYQLNREAMKLSQAIEEYRYEPSDKRRDAIALRMDILYSRLDVLDSAKYPRAFRSGSDFPDYVARAAEGIRAVDGNIQFFLKDESHPLDALAATAAELAKLIAGSEKMLLRANELVALDHTTTRNYVSNLYSVLAALMIAGTLVMIAIVASLAKKVAEVNVARRRLEDLTVELTAAADRARAASQAKSAFLATMSHEIRTPMNGVIGTVDVMLDMDMNQEMRSLASIIRSCGLSLLELINDILDFSKLEAGGVELEHIEFDPCVLVEDAARIVERRAVDKGLLLVVAPSFSADLRCVGDPSRLKQVVVNLVANAVKFTDKGSVVLRCLADDATGRLRVEVTDTGIGVPKEKLGHLFQEFNQLDASVTRKYGGTGLGLAICKRLIEQMGGQIGAISEFGKGSTFWFEVPGEFRHTGVARKMMKSSIHLAIDDPALRSAMVGILAYADGREASPDQASIVFELLRDDVGLRMAVTEKDGTRRLVSFLSPTMCVAAQAAEAGPQAPSIRRLRILAAEDNKVNQEILRRMLVGMGHDVTMVASGGEAVAAVTARGFDLVLMDMMMPEMDGLEATRRIRALSVPAGKVPILGVTANAFESDRAACLAAGMDGFLAKPVSKQALLAAIAGVAGQISSSSPDGGDGAAERDQDLIDGGRLAELAKELGPDGVAFILACYVDETKTLLDDLGRAMETGDSALRKRILHTIKGSSANIGFSDIEAHALDLMTSGDPGPERIAAFADLVRRAIDEAAIVRIRYAGDDAASGNGALEAAAGY